MTVQFGANFKNDMANQARNILNSGWLYIYEGEVLPSPEGYTPLTDPLVGFQISFNSASNGIIIPSGMPLTREAARTGTAAWFRFERNSRAITGTISLPGGDGDAILDNLALVQGELVSLKSFQLQVG